MNTKEYIESGILELYVYGLLTESENIEVAAMAKKHNEIEAEILSIEKSIVNLSTSFSPFLSAENFSKIKSKLDLKHTEVIQLKPNRDKGSYLGWVAAAILLIGIIYQYNLENTLQQDSISLTMNNLKLKKEISVANANNQETFKLLNIIRNSDNTIVNLEGQAINPKSFAKVYWNKKSKSVYIDGSGLPTPPEGMVYQVWALKLKPTLEPTSIGLLSNFSKTEARIFEVNNTENAEGFGITLEPAGGSKTPTMEQLYTLGTV